jgi:hypothetical protein
MNLNEDHEYTPSLKLLPFGGFEVAALLVQLHNGKNLRESTEDSFEFQANANVSSGWLRSKIMAG